ncbi:MAG: hypothetical protein AAF501_21500 [Pseudomonadota bacterium]
MTLVFVRFRKLVTVFFAGSLAGFLGLQAASAAETVPAKAGWLPSGAGDWRSGCNHYQNRARFLPRDGTIEFVVLLADACAAAEASLTSTNEHERWAAEWFLQEVVDLRDTIVDMNMRRVYGDTQTPSASPLTPDGSGRITRTIEIARVGKWGEYLIAHRMGLFSAYDTWLDSGASFSIAFQR